MLWAQNTIRVSEKREWTLMFMEHLLWARVSLTGARYLHHLSEEGVVILKRETC